MSSKTMTDTRPDVNEQLKQANALVEKSVSYIAEAQPTLEKYADFQDRFKKRAAEVTGVLVDRGIIAKSDSGALLLKLAEDEVRALDMIAKLAKLVQPDELGGQATEVKIASTRKVDPFEALVLFGDSSKTQPESSSLMVD